MGDQRYIDSLKHQLADAIRAGDKERARVLKSELTRASDSRETAVKRERA